MAGWLTDYSATSWPILQAETCQIFSQAEISRWAECGKITTKIVDTLLCSHANRRRKHSARTNLWVGVTFKRLGWGRGAFKSTPQTKDFGEKNLARNFF